MSTQKVAFLGPQGTYSHEAVLRAFPDCQSANHGGLYELLPSSTIRDCLEAVVKDKADYCVLPFENSTNGEVALTFDVLRDTFMSSGDTNGHAPEMPSIIDCVKVPIKHSLITNCERLDQITKVYSHPQVWGQCDIWYDSHLKFVEKIDTNSTSKAVALASVEPGCAAIGGKSAAATVKGMKILADNISNNPSNTTRFLVVSKHKPLDLDLDLHVTNDSLSIFYSLVSFTIEHKIPGALCKALQVFGERNINLTHIGSRPSGSGEPWTYVFFIEFQGHLKDPKIASAIRELESLCSQVRPMGSFKIRN